MLDNIANMIARTLGLQDAEVARIRDQLLEEQAAGGRRAATNSLEHPEGSSTPLNEAAMRAQNSFAKIRKQVEKELPRALALLLAANIAKQRRDEAEDARDRHWDAEYDRRDTGIHRATRDHFKRLFQHGVHPHALIRHRDEEVAIMADLSRWAAADPSFAHPDNPWICILGIYAERSVLRAQRGVTVLPSVPGRPAPKVTYSDPDYYMFADLLPVGVHPPAPVVEQPALPASSSGAGPRDEEAADDTSASPSAVGLASADEFASERDLYELPDDLPEAEYEALIAEAEKTVADDPDWQTELLAAIGMATMETEAAVIEAVAAAADVPGATPFRYFVDVARQDGVELGYYAYQGATVNRIAFELAMARGLVPE